MKEQQVTVENAETAPTTPTKISKNARKKLLRKQEEDERVNQARKMSELRVILRQSINGYSQEEAASLCLSKSNSESSQSQQE